VCLEHALHSHFTATGNKLVTIISPPKNPVQLTILLTVKNGGVVEKSGRVMASVTILLSLFVATRGNALLIRI
jgi:hypothetical protein